MTFKNLNEYKLYLEKQSSYELLMIEKGLENLDPKHEVSLTELHNRGYNKNDLSNKGIWEKYSKILNATYTDDSLFFPGQIVTQYKNWEVKISADTIGAGKDSKVYTFFKCDLENIRMFSFSFFSNSILKSLLKFLMLKKYDLFDEELNKNIVIQTNNKKLMSDLIWDSSFRKRLKELIDFRYPKFQLKDNTLIYRCRDILVDYEKMNGILELFRVALDRFTQIKIAHNKIINQNLHLGR